MAGSVLQVSRVRFEHHPSGLGVESPRPRLSWTVVPPTTAQIPGDWTQKSYEVQIRRGDKTSTFTKESSDTVLVPWPDEPLKTQEQASVRVCSHGVEGVNTEWSQWETVEAALLQDTDFTADFITLERTDNSHPDENGNRPLLFRKDFHVPSRPSRGRLYITALGIYEARINGKRVGDECLAPGWTSYQHRICYQVFDVGGLITEGNNTLSIEVAEGWYTGRLKWEKGEPNFYGDHNSAFAQLNLFGETGTIKVQTDKTWEAKVSPIVASGIYDGEAYDMRLESAKLPGWAPVKVLEKPGAALVPSPCPPVRVTEAIRPVSMTNDPDGKTLVDFGQNLVGRIHIPSLSKPEGHRLTVRHAEVLEHGRLGTRPLRNAKATDTVIFGEKALKDWRPRFTYHGFRYIEITGWGPNDPDDPLTLGSLCAEVMHTDMTRTGSFYCSDKKINQLHENVVWSMRGNFVSIPTDCPQRDERLGWTGDIQAFCPTASYLFNSCGMLANWMRDLLLEQKDDGGIVPLVVPNAMKTGPWPTVPQAVWDDVIILLPWVLYRNFGDDQVLRESWQGMKDYLNSIKRGKDGLWDPSLWQLGDWLDPNAPPAEPGLARTDGVLVADAYLIHVTSIMSEIGSVLGVASESEQFRTEAARLKHVFHDKYMAKSGLVVGDSQTALALCIVFGLHENDQQLQCAAERLARLVRFGKFRVSTGFAGTPIILQALSKGGYTQLAYRMLLEEGCPSWLYPVSKGSTTIWERWDSMLDDGSINPGEMTSFNHYALGSVAQWLHGEIGGIAPLQPGWKTFRVRPEPGGTITSARVSFLSPNGRIESSWELSNDGHLVCDVSVPPNTRAVIERPGMKTTTAGSGRHRFQWKVEQREPWPPKPLLTQFEDFDPDGQ